jgi:prevent-host-death family protein
MKTANIAELRNHLSRFLDYVRAGGRVVVLDRDRPVAEIIPLASVPPVGAGQAQLDDLERRGIVRQAASPLTASDLTGPLPGRKSGVLAALLEERRRDR